MVMIRALVLGIAPKSAFGLASIGLERTQLDVVSRQILSICPSVSSAHQLRIYVQISNEDVRNQPLMSILLEFLLQPPPTRGIPE